jgi:nucleoside-diphosphate-sugar epimerase
MKIFLTGGSGFIGRNILEQLGDKYEFLAPSHSELELLDEQAVENYLKDRNVDIVIHAANRGGNRKTLDLTRIVPENLRVFFNLVRCKPYYKHMLFLGSGAEYGKQRDLAKISEDDFGKVVPADDYGFYKYVCSQYINEVDFITNLRIFGIYGKYEDADIRFISQTLCKAIYDLPIVMHQNVVFDYVYIEDFVRILDHFIQTPANHKFYNIGTGTARSLESILEDIREVAKKTLPLTKEEEGLNKEYTCDNSRLVSELPKGFIFTDFKKTVKDLFDWYQSQKNNLPLERFS